MSESVLFLPLKGEYFDQIRSGVKVEEYRLVNDHWRKRLEGRSFDKSVLTRGYPPKSDTSCRIERPWRGFTIKNITHPHFGPDPVQVYAILVNGDGHE